LSPGGAGFLAVQVERDRRECFAGARLVGQAHPEPGGSQPGHPVQRAVLVGLQGMRQPGRPRDEITRPVPLLEDTQQFREAVGVRAPVLLLVDGPGEEERWTQPPPSGATG
jgi:hypothetical protein